MSGLAPNVAFAFSVINTGWLYLARLVVRTITPFPALDPQIEAAAASLSIEMLSISFGFMLDRSPSYGKLSTTINGFAFTLMSRVLRPRIAIPVCSFLPSVFLLNTIPLVIFSSRSNIFVLILLFNISLPITTNDPVALSLGIV